MGDIPDWLAQLAAEDEEAPDELKRDVDETEVGEAMPDMSASLDEILGFDAAPEPEAETSVFATDEPDPFAGFSVNEQASSDSDSLFSTEPLFLDDEPEEEEAQPQEEIVFDDLRSQAEVALPADLAESEPGMMDKLDGALASTGLKAWQRLVLAVLLLLDIGVIGVIMLVVLGFIQI